MLDHSIHEWSKRRQEIRLPTQARFLTHTETDAGGITIQSGCRAEKTVTVTQTAAPNSVAGALARTGY